MRVSIGLLTELDKIDAPLEHFRRDLNHARWAHEGNYVPPRGLLAAVRNLRRLVQQAHDALDSQKR